MLDEFHLSLPLKRDHTKLVPEVLELRPQQWLGEHIRNLILDSHELEPHYSPLYHIHEVVVFDLDMLQLVMEHNVPPRLRDGGTRVRGDVQGGRVEVPPNFRDFWEMGDGGTSHI
jgi:hypothetical protein